MKHNSQFFQDAVNEMEAMDVISRLEMCMVDEDICPTDVAM